MSLSRMAIRYYRVTTPEFSSIIGVRDYVVVSAGPSLAEFKQVAVDRMFEKLEGRYAGTLGRVDPRYYGEVTAEPLRGSEYH